MMIKKNMKKIALWLFIITVVSLSISIVLFRNAGVSIKDFENIDTLDDNFEGRFNMDVNLENSFEALDIEDIKIDTISTDIRLIPEDRKDIKIHLHGSISSSTKIVLPEIIGEKYSNTLGIKIDYKNFTSNKHYRYYSSNMKLDIYIPNEYSKDIYIETTSGNINLGRLNINSIDLASVSGDINAKTLYTKKAKLKSISGKIKIEDFKGGLSAKTTSGDLSVDAKSLDDDFHMKSISGDVDIQLPDKSEFYVDLKSISGDISFEFPISIEDKIRDTAIKGRAGKGDNKITISTTSGDIKILKTTDS